MTRKIFTLLSLVLTVAFVLTACGPAASLYATNRRTRHLLHQPQPCLPPPCLQPLCLPPLYLPLLCLPPPSRSQLNGGILPLRTRA